MRLVVDTNIIIAALIRDSVCRKILLSPRFEFITIGLTRFEIEAHKPELLEKARISEEEFSKIFSLLFSKLFIITDGVIKSKMSTAITIMDNIDPDDTPFIALALAVQNDGIWSDDKHFQDQNKVRVFTTRELISILNSD